MRTAPSSASHPSGSSSQACQDARPRRAHGGRQELHRQAPRPPLRPRLRGCVYRDRARGRLQDFGDLERHGEAHFRDGERRVIARLLDQPLQVLATGGGAFMDARTREKIRECGISIWLRADLELLLRRTARRTNRPLLNNGDRRTTLARLMEARHPVYAAADIVVDSNDASRAHGRARDRGPRALPRRRGGRRESG